MAADKFVEYAETYARQHGEIGTISLRHLQRLASGHGANGKSLGTLRPATVRLLEGIFGISVEKLLEPPERVEEASQPATVPLSGGRSAQAGRFGAALDWLDRHSCWPPGMARRTWLSLVEDIGGRGPTSWDYVGRSQVARALLDYYGDFPAGYRAYRCHDRAGGVEVATSVVTRADWVGLGCSLRPANEQIRLALDDWAPPRELIREEASQAAAARLAAIAALDAPLTDAPLYRLLEIAPRPRVIAGTVGLAHFIEYALTVDLLEGELVEALATGQGRPGTLPLRATYLPDGASVLNLRGRLCVGGALALCAVARPRDPFRGGADYALLVQERSSRVLNAVGRLAVIPKGFHQPLTDPRADVQIGATLRRELEEELFGRTDVDGTAGQQRAALPMHPSRLSEPMRWLDEDPDRWRMECTAFGLNLVSGNYEFAGLIVIEDEGFWPRFGGMVEANWEASGLRLYSSLDRELLGELVHDPAWSNEGLFAFLEGLRRLREIGGRRVDLPEFEVVA